jgi:tetratricopeptide (TPR) repeat protein
MSSLQRQLFEQAMQQIDQQDWDGSIRLLSEVIRSNHGHGEAYFYRAVALAKKGDINGALADCDEAIRCSPREAQVYALRASLYATTKRWNEALENYNQAVRFGPGNINYLKRRADCRRQLDNLRGAHLDYSAILELAPHDYDAWVKRGIVLKDLRAYEEAIADLTHAIQLDPRNHFGYLFRSIAYTEWGNHPAALADYEQHLTLSSQRQKGLSRDSQERLDDLKRMAHALYEEPTGDKAADLFVQACALVDGGDPDSLSRALSMLNEVIKADPLFADAYYQRGRTFALMNRLDFARDNLDQAIRLEPDMAAAYVLRADVHQQLGDLKSALADYEEYLTTNVGKRDEQRDVIEARVEELRKQVSGGRGGLFRRNADR